MKVVIPLAAAVMAMAVAGSALAADPIMIGGDAEKVCTLPTSWVFHSGNAGAAAGQFSGTTWTIPESAFATTTSQGTQSSSRYAIRIRGTGFCNTSHSITLVSSRGGLTAGAPGATPPGGFTNRRAMLYEAFWSNGGNAAATIPVGPMAILNASVPGQQADATYTVSGALAPPGNRTFDIRLVLDRNTPVASPLIAGAYSDTVTVTLAVIG